MKKFLSLVALTTIAFAVSAQTENAWVDADSYYGVSGGTVLASSDNVEMFQAFDETLKTSYLTSATSTVTINGVEYPLNEKGGLIGSTNPTPNNLGTATDGAWIGGQNAGAVFGFNVKKDGFLFIFCRITSTKQYYVWEGDVTNSAASLVAYRLVGHGLNDASIKCDYTLPAIIGSNLADAEAMTTEAEKWLKSSDVIAAANVIDPNFSSGNAFGVIIVPVRASAVTYYVNACGSKLVSNGFVFFPKYAPTSADVAAMSVATEGNTISINFDESGADVSADNIAEQITLSENVISGLIYNNVAGVSELQALIDEAKAVTSETDAETMKTLLSSLQQQTKAVKALDEKYQALETMMGRVETTIQNNPNADAIYVAEATSKITEVRAGMANGDYTAQDVADLNSLMLGYNKTLSEAFVTVDVTEAGTLGDLILDNVENFTDVKGLRISGKLNTTDLERLKDLTNMVELNMAETNVTTLSESQFQNMTKLTKVVLPKKLTDVNNYAFSGCTALTDVTLPAGLRVINTYAFRNCTKLSKIDFPETLVNIGNYAFYCERTSKYVNGNYVYTGGSLEEISLPASLTKLGECAFYGQTALKKVTIADGLAEIGNYAFGYCTNLTDLTLPATLKTIGYDAFEYCSALKSVELPEGLTTLGYEAFAYCDSLKEAILPSSLQSVSSPFYGSNQLTKITAKAIVPANTNNSDIMSSSHIAKCTLTVPALSVKVYKQASKWSQFNIVGENIMPDNIYVNTDYRLNWPDSLNIDYRPNVEVAANAALTVTGNSTLSASDFVLNWDAYEARRSSQWDSETSSYYYDRNDKYSALLNQAHARADNVWINLKTYRDKWEFISLPFDIKVSDIRSTYEGTPFVIRKYNGEKRAQGLTSETWVDMTADSTLVAGQGYIWRSASTDGSRYYNSFIINALQTINKNNIFANSDLDIELAYYESEFEHNRSWNLIGNPFPCYYDIRAMQTTAPITVWNTYNNNYQAYSPQDDAYILNPGQAFFVQRPIDQEKITFLKEGRQIDMTARDAAEFTTGNVANSFNAVIENARTVFNLTLSGNDKSDRTRFVINSAAKMDYESSRDASKFMSEENDAIHLYTVQNGISYAINERPLSNGIVELGMKLNESGSYTLSLDNKVNNEAYLIDRMAGTETLLNNATGYDFTTEATSIEGRFAIRIGDGEATGIVNVNANDSVVGNGNGAIYNLNGQRVAAPAKGIYIKNGNKTVMK